MKHLANRLHVTQVSVLNFYGRKVIIKIYCINTLISFQDQALRHAENLKYQIQIAKKFLHKVLTREIERQYLFIIYLFQLLDSLKMS